MAVASIAIVTKTGVRRDESSALWVTNAAVVLDGPGPRSLCSWPGITYSPTRNTAAISITVNTRLVLIYGDKMLFRRVEEGADGAQFGQERWVSVSA
jgi:hypothetical protein